jgi:UV DNA damage endonuclease
LSTWDREPLFYISSPLNSWQDGNQRNHHDFIDPEDLPEFWLKQDVTVEVEAKAKELAVLKLIREVNKNR